MTRVPELDIGFSINGVLWNSVFGVKCVMFVEVENFIVTLLVVVNRILLIPWLARKILESILSTKRQLQNTL